MTKDILIVRLSKVFSYIEEEEKDNISALFDKKLSNSYIVITMFNENQTDKTTFEIIKYD